MGGFYGKKRTKKESRAIVRRALSMPEPGQSIALREVFDKTITPVIGLEISVTRIHEA
jgi:hypothetical protein